MKCKEIQELILTDYLDGEMIREEEEKLEAHIADCNRCREFEAAARKTVMEPFHNAEKRYPPEAVWTKIKGQLEQEQKEKKSLPGFMNRFYSSFDSEKLVFGSVAVMVLLLGAIFLMGPPGEKGKMATGNLEEQVDYLAYLAEGSNQFTTEEDEGFGTSIEEYFL